MPLKEFQYHKGKKLRLWLCFTLQLLLMCDSTNSPSQITCKSLLNKRQDSLKTTLRGHCPKLQCFFRLHPIFILQKNWNCRLTFHYYFDKCVLCLFVCLFSSISWALFRPLNLYILVLSCPLLTSAVLNLFTFFFGHKIVL